MLLEALRAEQLGADRRFDRFVGPEKEIARVVAERVEPVDDRRGAQATANSPMTRTTARQAIVTMRPAATERARCSLLFTANQRPCARAQCRMCDASASKSPLTKSIFEWVRRLRG